jgi:hypothetical protein
MWHGRLAYAKQFLARARRPVLHKNVITTQTLGVLVSWRLGAKRELRISVTPDLNVAPIPPGAGSLGVGPDARRLVIAEQFNVDDVRVAANGAIFDVLLLNAA